jgi:hypothetical protein
VLSFHANEGVDLGVVNGQRIYSDGDDRLFGDLGNDWLVGGTGRDHMYGGWGEDLLNADDDHATNGGLNDVPDDQPSYADLGFGGAGRDRLIANTPGDRLIDWSGAHNSYIVPFVAGNEGTVSSSLQPQLPEFLYALSVSDGADPTRALDAGTDAERNGEPEGELGLLSPQDPDWRFETGAPLDVSLGDIPAGPRDLVSAASFNDGNMDGFAPDSGTWTVQDGVLEVSAESLGGDAVSVYHIDAQLPAYFELLASIKIVKPTAGWKGNAYLIFDYHDPQDFKFAGIDDSVNKLLMGHRDATGWHVDEQAPVPGGLKYDTFYNMLVAVNGTSVTLVVNNQDVFSHTYPARMIDGYAYNLNYGYVGVGSDNSRGVFDNVRVQILPPQVTFENIEDFEDGLADLFTAGTVGTWTIDAGLDDNHRYNVTPAGETAVSLLDLGPDTLNLNAYLELNAVVSTQGRAGIVFDRYGVESFKYATIDAASDLLIIGHYTSKHGWIEDAVIGTAIDAGQDYVLGVALKGTTVSVTLGSGGGVQAIVSHTFNAATVDGDFGLLAIDGSSSFDDVEVKTDDPVFLTGQLLTAATAGAGATVIAADEVRAVLAEAQRRLIASLLGDSSAEALVLGVNVEVVDLGGLVLARVIGNTIFIDDDAAGHGWFVDATPSDDSEFDIRAGDGLKAAPSSDAYGRMDLLSALTHELGHVAGLTHDDGFAFMSSVLEAGVRLAPTGSAIPHHVASRDSWFIDLRPFATPSYLSVSAFHERFVNAHHLAFRP